jgi:hypothetical protein
MRRASPALRRCPTVRDYAQEAMVPLMTDVVAGHQCGRGIRNPWLPLCE